MNERWCVCGRPAEEGSTCFECQCNAASRDIDLGHGVLLSEAITAHPAAWVGVSMEHRRARTQAEMNAGLGI